MTFFSQMEPKFPPLPSDRRIKTVPFLEACRQVTEFIDILGPFKIVKTDINGNIEKLQRKYDMDPQKFETFNDMLEEEMEVGKTTLAQVGGLWLKRGLEFMNAILKNMVEEYRSGKKEASVKVLVSKAYEDTLKRYHGWFVQKLFGAILITVPDWKSLMSTMSCKKENMEEQVISDVETYIATMSENLQELSSLYKRMNLDSDEKV